MADNHLGYGAFIQAMDDMLATVKWTAADINDAVTWADITRTTNSFWRSQAVLPLYAEPQVEVDEFI